MLRIKAAIGPSRIHGLGLFADQRIQKGALVSAWDAGFDREFSQEEVGKLSPIARDFIDDFGWTTEEGKIRVSMDHGRYTNHSKDANLEVRDGGTFALRDIESGEELVEDYATYDADFPSYGSEWK